MNEIITDDNHDSTLGESIKTYWDLSVLLRESYIDVIDANGDALYILRPL